MKRILYLINTFGAGGAERQLVYLIGGLDRSRFDPVVCTLYDDAAYPPHPAYVEQLAALGVPRHTLAHGPGWRGRTDALRRLIALEWRLRPGIVHGFLHYANLMVRAARPFCPPHRLFTSAQAEFLPGELRSEAWTWWLDDKLTYMSVNIQRQVETGTRRPVSRHQMIPYGTPVEEFAENPAPSWRREHFPDTPFVVGLVGRLVQIKNIPTLITALTFLPYDTKAFIIGATGDASEEVGNLIQSLNLTKRVQIFLPVADVRPFYHGADVMVLPSFSEGLPNVVLEAFAAGRLVVVSEGANGAGLVRHGVNGWVFPTGDASALADRLRHIRAMSEAERAPIREQARQTAQCYSIPAMVARFTALYTGTPLPDQET